MHSNRFRDQPAHLGKNRTVRIRLIEHLRPQRNAIYESGLAELGDITLDSSRAGPDMSRDLTQ